MLLILSLLQCAPPLLPTSSTPASLPAHASLGWRVNKWGRQSHGYGLVKSGFLTIWLSVSQIVFWMEEEGSFPKNAGNLIPNVCWQLLRVCVSCHPLVPKLGVGTSTNRFHSDHSLSELFSRNDFVKMGHCQKGQAG